jgi:hypothetical protein
MPSDFSCAFHLKGPVTLDQGAESLSRLAEVFASHGLLPSPVHEEAWQRGKKLVFGGTSLIYAAGQQAARRDEWGAAFGLLSAKHVQRTILYMSTPAHVATPGLHPWRWLTGLCEVLAPALGADLATINGRTIQGDTARGGSPSGPELAPGHPPGIVCPWMYWSPARLKEDGLLSRLAELPAFRSSPLQDGGWVLQAHEDYTRREPSALLDACAESWRTPKPLWVA